MKIRSLTMAVCALWCGSATTAEAAVPSGYYSSCENKSGAALLTALNQKISSHTTISYKGLLDLYKTSDVKANGKIWDMYSTKEWNTGETCGNYSYVGDCYNREHSMPKSWFNDASPMYSDAFHLYPTDGKVNGQRGNYPYGECASGTTLPSHGGVQALGKLGKSTFSGYSGTVFEPDDEYKGDFARSYFYMAACYNDRISSWSSDMLAGNKYPAFTTWAVNLLLKWHRQDPVSEKEIARNEVVYNNQHNRNPFIDYPDLAEHIWGDKKTVAWSTSGSAEATLSQPVNGTVIDFGYAAIGHPVSRYITVKGANLSSPASVSVNGAGFSCAVSSLSASDVNSGVSLTISFSPVSVSKATGTLTIKSGTATATVTLSGEGVDGIPVSEPTQITSESFTFTWVNIDDASAKYIIDVTENGGSVLGYPTTVNASLERYTVADLLPETTYSYRISSSTMDSRTMTVTTGALVPWIGFLYDGDLYFSTEPGVPSDAAELMIETENIDGDITLTVSEPFELSTDKAAWTPTITLLPDEDRFYLRMNAAESGEYHSVIKAVAGNYSNDDTEINGIAASTPEFVETFECDNDQAKSYYTGNIAGVASPWTLEKIYFNANAGEAHSGEKSIRFNKSGSDSYLVMAADKMHGAGEVSFYAKAWSNPEPGDITLSYSTDGGLYWTEVKKFNITSASYQEYRAAVNVSGNVRLKFDRTSGGRVCLDDISIANYTGTVSIADLDYHRWDAFGRNHELVIETYSGLTLDAAVVGTDGVVYYNGSVNGELSIALPAGLYIVVIDDYARRVVVR